MREPVFSSHEDLREAFVGKLRALIDDARTDLSVTALVIANTVHDPQAREALLGEVTTMIRTLRADPEFVAVVGAASPEDRAVWNRVLQDDSRSLAATRVKRLGPWRLQYNAFRALRPKRLARASFPGIRLPFRDDGFNFNRPDLVAESFRQKTEDGRPGVSVFFNKFPFADLHTLIVPNRLQGRPQYLEESDVEWAWDETKETPIPGFGMGYNSIGAFASVNHLHFQTFVAPEGLPVMAPQWTHNGGAEIYPIRCNRFDSPVTAWRWIDARHRRGAPYNLVFDTSGIYAIGRRHQSSCTRSAWTTGFAWFELAGSIIVNSAADLEALGQDDIEEELGRLGDPDDS